MPKKFDILKEKHRTPFSTPILNKVIIQNKVCPFRRWSLFRRTTEMEHPRLIWNFFNQCWQWYWFRGISHKFWCGWQLFHPQWVRLRHLARMQHLHGRRHSRCIAVHRNPWPRWTATVPARPLPPSCWTSISPWIPPPSVQTKRHSDGKEKSCQNRTHMKGWWLGDVFITKLVFLWSRLMIKLSVGSYSWSLNFTRNGNRGSVADSPPWYPSMRA